MDESTERTDALIRSGARRLTGFQRRAFQAEVAVELCSGNARQAERRFGWGRETVEKGLHERHTGIRCLEDFVARGRQRVEDRDQRLAADIRAIAEPHSYADPSLKSARRYTNLSAAEVRTALIARGHAEADLPAERTMRNILNRMNYRLKRIRKGKPLKKTEETCDWVLEIVKRNESVKGWQLLPRRWVVERTISWLNGYRRLSRDYEYWPQTSEAFIQIAMIHLMLHRLAPQAVAT
jgi:transposase